MAVVYSFVAGKPFSALPNMTFTANSFNNCHPPIVTNKQHKPDDPFNKNPYYVVNPKNQRP